MGVAVACCSVFLLRTFPLTSTLRIREVRMYYEFISLWCGKCDAIPLHYFPTNTTVHTYV